MLASVLASVLAFAFCFTWEERRAEREMSQPPLQAPTHKRSQNAPLKSEPLPRNGRARMSSCTPSLGPKVDVNDRMSSRQPLRDSHLKTDRKTVVVVVLGYDGIWC